MWSGFIVCIFSVQKKLFMKCSGCDARLKNRNGKTASQVAKEAGKGKASKACRKLERKTGANFKSDKWVIALFDFTCQKGQQLLDSFEDADSEKTGMVDRETFLAILREHAAPFPDNELLFERRIIAPHQHDDGIEYIDFISGSKYISKGYR